MATENNNDQPAPGKEPALEQEPERPSKAYQGRVQNGVLYCNCGNLKAQCRTVTQSKANMGRKYWQCRLPKDERCTFYIWDEEAPAAKAWLAKYGPPPVPETPSGKGKEPTNTDNPWTLSISKRKIASISRDASDEDENGGPSGSNPNELSDAIDAEGESDEIGDPDSPSRKAAKRTTIDTPGHILGERLRNAEAALPTPDTGKRPEAAGLGVASGSRSSNTVKLASARLGDVIDLTEDTEDTPSDLTRLVLDELRSANVGLKESTVTIISDLIDTEVELHNVRMRRSQRTISTMRKRLDELESLVYSLTGGDEDDAVQLSD